MLSRRIFARIYLVKNLEGGKQNETQFVNRHTCHHRWGTDTLGVHFPQPSSRHIPHNIWNTGISWKEVIAL